MAVQYISSAERVCGKRIRLPRQMSGLESGYEVFDKENVIKTFYSDNGAGRDLHRWIVPKNAFEMEFMPIQSPEGVIVGPPIYYDFNGNVVKVGNH